MRLRFLPVLIFVATSSASIAQTSDQAKPAIPSKTKIELINEKKTKAVRMNEIVDQLKQAIQAREWRQVEDLSKKLIVEDPEGWQFYQGLGSAQLNLAEYDDAIKTDDKAWELISRETETPADTERTKARTAAMSAILTSQGNAYLKLKKNDEAVRLYAKAAAMDPNPGTAYFNLCATLYNQGDMQGAISACDRGITADPLKADAYFIKGSALFGMGTLDKQNRFVAPPGTMDALHKYLELSPEGSHATDVKAMLEAAGAKVETTYQENKK